MICPICQKEHPDGTKFCPVTGQSLIVANLCPFCGQSHPANIQYCPITGKSMYRSPAGTKPGKQVRLWFVLAIFLLLSAVVVGIWVVRNNNPNSTVTSPEAPTGTPSSLAILSSGIPEVISQTPVNNSVLTAAALTVQTGLTQIATPTFTPTISNKPLGKIVYTCQIFKNENRNQICIVNADGTNQRRLTPNDRVNYFYPSIAPDGMSIVFSSNQTGVHEIFEMDLDGNQKQLTSLGNLYAPEISPDGLSIVFTNANSTFASIWVMDRNGNNPREIYRGNKVDAVDPTWSPEGERILFAMGSGDNKKLYVINKNGSNLNTVNENFATRGRSDWSWEGGLIAGYSGGSWQRKIYLMNSDGSNLIELYSSGNVQAPSFSPNDKWVTFTGYIDNMGNGNGCEIYILTISGQDLTRLTNNDFCDWQPRWGP